MIDVLASPLAPALADAVATKSSADHFRSIAAATSSERNWSIYVELDRLARLEPNWDGFGGVAPCDAAIEQAKQFVANMSAELCRPAIEPAGDGEINLVWRSASAYLEIGFTGDESFSFLGKRLSGTAERAFGDVPLLTNRLPLTLHAYMGLFPDVSLRLRERESERESVAWTS